MNDAFEKTVFADLADLEKSLREDLSGDRARALIGYYVEVSKSTETMLSNAKDAVETRTVGQLIEGFNAAQRIIRQVWESLHQGVLAV